MNPEEQEKKSLVSFTPQGTRIYDWKLAKKHHLQTEDEILNAYNKNDTQALFRILTNIWAEYPQAKGKLTVAGLSFYCWKKENPQQLKKLNNLAKPWADDLRDFCQQGYFAALEDNFNESIWKNTVYKYDVNAFYPFLMKIHTFPIGRPRFMKKIRQEFNPEEEIGFIEVEFENLQIKEEEGWVPFLPIEDQGIKVNFGYCKTYRNVLPTPLLELALQAYSYSAFRILKKCLFINKEKGYFKDFVEKYAEKKENSERDSLSYVMAKNILTNLYGKFGQQVFRREWKLKPVEKKLSFTPTYWDNNGNPWHFRQSKEEQRTRGFNFVPISAFTTAYARVFMVKTIKEIGRENILYCAKDSIVSKMDLPAHEIHPTKTGYWKLEETADEFISHSAKAYDFGGNKIMKSLKKEEAQKLDYQKLQTKPLKVVSQTSFKTNQGVVITQKEKVFRPALANLKKDLINGRWVNRRFYHDWDWWDRQKIIKENEKE